MRTSIKKVLESITLKAKLLTGFLLVIMACIFPIVYNSIAVSSLLNRIQETNNHPLKVIRITSDIKSSVISIHRAMKDYAISTSDDEFQMYMDIVEKTATEVNMNFVIIEDIVLSEKGLALVKVAHETFLAWESIRGGVFSAISRNQIQEAIVTTRSTGADHVKLLQNQLDNIITYASSMADRFNTESETIAQRTSMVIILLLSLIVPFTIFTGLWITNNISSRVNQIRSASNKMAEGDLEQVIGISGHDELSELAKSFNIMSRQLSLSQHTLEHRIKERTHELKTANEELSILKAGLEDEVKIRTQELNEKVLNLDKAQKAMLYMIEDLNATRKELVDTQEQLVRNEKLAAIGQMAGSIGHELRNPLGVISNAVYYLNMVNANADDETVNEYMQIITDEINKSNRIITDMLEFGRIRQGQHDDIGVTQLIEDVLSRIPEQENIKLIQERPEIDFNLKVDYLQVSQVLTNLVTNACQSINGAGTVMIRAKQDGTVKQIEVSDTGCGIAAEELKKIFEPLYTTKTHGIGLGLPLSEKLIQLNGGKITVSSETGKGSIFTIQFEEQ